MVEGVAPGGKTLVGIKKVLCTSEQGEGGIELIDAAGDSCGLTDEAWGGAKVSRGAEEWLIEDEEGAGGGGEQRSVKAVKVEGNVVKRPASGSCHGLTYDGTPANVTDGELDQSGGLEAEGPAGETYDEGGGEQSGAEVAGGH